METEPEITLEYLQANAVATLRGETDNEHVFLRWIDYLLPDGRCHRAVLSGFNKQNPFATPDEPGKVVEGEVGGVREFRPVTELSKTVGCDDLDNVFVSWVEYHLPGQSKEFHRSVDAKLKRPPGEARAQAGNLR